MKTIRSFFTFFVALLFVSSLQAHNVKTSKNKSKPTVTKALRFNANYLNSWSGFFQAKSSSFAQQPVDVNFFKELGFSKKTIENYKVLASTAKDNSADSRRKLLLALVVKLEQLYPSQAPQNTILDLFFFANYTNTTVLTTAIAMYLHKHEDLMQDIDNEELDNLLKDIDAALSQDFYSQAVYYAEIGALPIIGYNEKSRSYFVAPAQTAEGFTIISKFLESENYLAHCLELAPQQIEYDLLSPNQQAYIEDYMGWELVETQKNADFANTFIKKYHHTPLQKASIYVLDVYLNSLKSNSPYAGCYSVCRLLCC